MENLEMEKLVELVQDNAHTKQSNDIDKIIAMVQEGVPISKQFEKNKPDKIGTTAEIMKDDLTMHNFSKGRQRS